MREGPFVKEVRRLLALARATTDTLEVYKHRDQRELIEVQLIEQVERVEALLCKKTTR